VLASCLRDATGSSDALVATFLSSLFSAAAPHALREEMAAIVGAFHPSRFRLMALSCAELDTRPLLLRMAVPTLVLWGADDQRSPLYVANQLHTAIPGAELAIIPNAGHLSNMEQPDVFNAHVRRFCRER
jgi:pimeloyl-ACP methyl ester carboxylesterase